MRSTLCAASRTLTGILFVLICSNLAWADASSWLTAVSGNWSDATKWDNGLPNNGTTLYDAIIAAAGASPYTVTMKSAATVNSFTLNSPQATLDITTGGTLSLAGPAPSQLWAGVLKFSGGTLKGGQLDLHGNSITATATGGTLDGVNVLGDFNLTGKSGKLTVANGTTFQGSNITVTDATLTINQDAVWNDKAVTMQSVSSGPGISVASSRTLTLGPATVVTSNGFTIIWSMLDSTVITQGKISGQAVELGSFTNSGQIQGGSMYLGYSGCQWVNAASGVISCDSALAPAGRLPAFDLAGTWRNDGLMTFANFTFGDGDLAFQGTGTNAGTMSFSGCFVSFPSAVSRTPKVRNTGTMTFTNCDITGAPTLEGNFSITGGTWQFTQDDRIDNTGHVLNLGGGAKVTALNYSSGYGAGIKGGTIKVVGGVQLSGSLDGVTIEGDVTIPDRKTLNLYESGTAPSVIHGNVNMTRGELGYTIIAPGGSLTFANTYTFPTSPWSSSYVLTNMAVIDSGVPAGVTLTGSGSACIHANLDISNKGTITLNQPNTTLWIWNDWVRDQYFTYWDEAEKKFGVPYFPNVTMGWDSSPRAAQQDEFGDFGYPFMNTIGNNTPANFRQALELTKRRLLAQPTGPQILNINCWNEWTEGSYLEPDTVHGLQYLEAVAGVFRK